MKTSFPPLQATFVGNTEGQFQAVLSVLADNLGVSDKSLRDLSIGYAPLVKFTKRTSERWWSIPERNAEGEIVGLSLRSEKDGTKVMYPGSKHGLIYAVRPDYKPGSKEYTPGKQNWVRTMDAGVPCPICGKPDGCLLSSENPHDPKAVLCIREQAGSSRPGNVDTGGWLHIRKPDGVVSRNGPLRQSDYPTVIVEGASDCAAALDLSLESVGRPSNLAGLGLLKKLVEGRKVIIVGENDKKPDGKWPGRVGMEATFATLRNDCAATMVLPPEEYKDFRQWKTGANLTRESFLEYVAKNGVVVTESRILESVEPLVIAERWLQEENWADGFPTLRRYASHWYKFDGTRYAAAMDGPDIRGRLYAWLTGRLVMTETAGGEPIVKKYAADMSKVTNIVDALWRDCPLRIDPPCWIDGRTSPEPQNLICFPNGLFDVNQFLYDGSSVLHPLTPLFFTFHTLPYEYSPDARCPLWLKFLGQIFPDDHHKIRLLQEWFGYNLVPDTSQQKMMVMLGKAGSGKSTTLHVLAALLGHEQVAQTSFDQLGEKFGISQLIGKLAALIPDGHIGRYTDTKILMERLKVLTGENNGRMGVRKMREDASEARFYARVTIATNEPPEFPDDANAMHRRTLALLFTEEFVKNPDRSLPERLAAEAPGIFNWALEGLARLRARGVFSLPESSIKLIGDLSRIASPLQQFVYDCGDVTSGGEEPTDVLVQVWRNWMREQGGSGGMPLKFIHNLCMNFNGLRQVFDVRNGQRTSKIVGLSLTKEAKEKYLSR